MVETTRRAVMGAIVGGLVMAASEEKLAWAFDFDAIEGGGWSFRNSRDGCCW